MPKAFRAAAGMTGLGLLLLVMGAAIFGPFSGAPTIRRPSTPPTVCRDRRRHIGWAHDQFGRDLLSRLLNGAPSTVFFGLGATLFGGGRGQHHRCDCRYRGRLDRQRHHAHPRWVAGGARTALHAAHRHLFSAAAWDRRCWRSPLPLPPGMARIARSSVLSIRTRE